MWPSTRVTQLPKRFLLLILLIMLGSPLPVFAIAQLRLQIADQVVPGDIAVVQIVLSEAEGIGSLNLTVGYNAEFLTEPQVTSGELGGGASITSSAEQPGVLRIQVNNPQGINGSGTLLELEFETSPTLTTSLPLSLTAQGFNLEDQPLPVRTLGTTISVLPLESAITQAAEQEEQEQQEENQEENRPERRIARVSPSRRESPAAPSAPIDGAITFTQEPEMVLSDGKEIAKITITFEQKGRGVPDLSYSLLNGELVRKPVVREQSAEFQILPTPGTSRTVLYILGQDSVQPIELQVFPSVDIDFNRSGVIGEHLHSLLMQQMGKQVGKNNEELRRYDLNDDGIIDEQDLAIFSANYAKKRP